MCVNFFSGALCRAAFISGTAVNILLMLTLMCFSQLIKQRSHQLWDSQSIYSSNGQRRAEESSIQRESRGKLHKYNTDTHILDPLLNHTGLELKCKPKAGLALFIVKCGCIKQTLNTAGTSGTAEKPRLRRPP